MQSLIGKTIKSIGYPSKHDKVIIIFTDDTILEVREVGYTGELEVRLNNQVIEDAEESNDDLDDENADPFFDDFHEDNHKY